MVYDPVGPAERWLDDDGVLTFNASVALSPRMSRRTRRNRSYRRHKRSVARRIQYILRMIRERRENALVPATKLWSTWTAEAGFTALLVAYPVLECMAKYLHQSDFKSLSYSSKTMYSIIQQTCGKKSWKIVNRLTCTGFHKAKCHFSKCRIPVCTDCAYPLYLRLSHSAAYALRGKTVFMRSGETRELHTLTLTCAPCWFEMYRDWEARGLLSKKWPYELHAARWQHGNWFSNKTEAEARLVSWSLLKTGPLILDGAMDGLKLED
ncbi:hypothetical protein EV426DRAFT_577170 [Tirmania nivea]|nr:hypothetical protein EV426DRAFT_577170 [Tirmania nivea]